MKNLEKYFNTKTAISFKSKKEYDEFIDYLSANYETYNFKRFKKHWDYYENDTCLELNFWPSVTFCRSDWVQKENYEIFEYNKKSTFEMIIERNLNFKFNETL